MKPGELALISLFAALTTVGAQITFPIGPVPITLQVLFVLLSGLLMGSKLGFLSQVLYLFLGLIGLPVFSHLGSGIATLYGPTGGYLLAFPMAAYVSGLFKGRRKVFQLIGAFLGIGIVYLLGWARLSLILGSSKAFYVGVLPFIGIDLAKAITAVIIASAVKNALPDTH